MDRDRTGQDAAPEQGAPPPMGAVIFALAAALAMAIYAWTVLEAARNAGDWLLIVPAAGIGIAALLWAATRDLRAVLRHRLRRLVLSGDDTKPALLLALIGLYALALPFAGFDGATLVFLGLALRIQGERRLGLILLNAVIGTALLVWIFHGLLAVRLPLVIL